MRCFNPYRMFNGVFIPNAILRTREISQSAKFVWASLARFAGKDGRCYPKLDTVADDIGMSREMVKKKIKELKEKGFIAVRHATGKARLMHQPSQYFFIYHSVFTDKERLSAVGVHLSPSVGGNPGTCKEGEGLAPPIEMSKLNEPITTSDPDLPSGGGCDKKKFHGTTEDHALAHKMYRAILVVNQTIKEPNYDKWANTIRLMREQDGRDHAGIWHVFDWANRDEFWQQNILSPSAVRRHYSKLASKAGLVRSRVRGVSADVSTHQGDGRRCGECVAAGKNKQLCAGWDTDPDHPACELFQPALSVVK